MSPTASASGRRRAAGCSLDGDHVVAAQRLRTADAYRTRRVARVMWIEVARGQEATSYRPSQGPPAPSPTDLAKPAR
jgi:hypothetical protein